MYLTEKEIASQHIALEKTYKYLLDKKDEFLDFWNKKAIKTVVFIGCGSSYMLAEVGAKLFANLGYRTFFITGGEYLLNPASYENLLKSSLVVSLSRSGKTSEIIRSLKIMREELDVQVLSLSMRATEEILELSDFNLVMDWAYDDSVCQTRTVTNLYTALLVLATIISEDTSLNFQIKDAILKNLEFRNSIDSTILEIAKKDWNKVVVLCDGVVSGLAKEGALAFTEISLLPGISFGLLDYRHGPIVLNDEKTLTVCLLQDVSDTSLKLQRDMLKDIKEHGGICVSVATSDFEDLASDYHFNIAMDIEHSVAGIFFINILQLLSLKKALDLGHNPDLPKGLDAFITLK